MGARLPQTDLLLFHCLPLKKKKDQFHKLQMQGKCEKTKTKNKHFAELYFISRDRWNFMTHITVEQRSAWLGFISLCSSHSGFKWIHGSCGNVEFFFYELLHLHQPGLSLYKAYCNPSKTMEWIEMQIIKAGHLKRPLSFLINETVI